MNHYSLLVGAALIIYTVLGTEVYAKLLSSFRGRWVVVVFYGVWGALFMIGPMFVMEYCSQALHLFSLEERKPGFFLWLAGVTAYLFLFRRKHLSKLVGPLGSSK